MRAAVLVEAPLEEGPHQRHQELVDAAETRPRPQGLRRQEAHIPLLPSRLPAVEQPPVRHVREDLLDGPAHRPAAVLTTGVDAPIAISSGQCSLGTALRAGAALMDGDLLAAARYDSVFGYDTGEAAH